MNMKKNQKVRLLKDNSIGIITDSTFFSLGGKKYIRYQVTIGRNKTGCWYSAEELAPVTERVKITMSSENGKELYADLIFNHDKQELNIKITGNPENLKEHTGLHTRFMSIFIEGLTKGNKVINRNIHSKSVQHE